MTRYAGEYLSEFQITRINYDLKYVDDSQMDLSQEFSATWGNDHVRLLTNSQATKSAILDAIDLAGR